MNYTPQYSNFELACKYLQPEVLQKYTAQNKEELQKGLYHIIRELNNADKKQTALNCLDVILTFNDIDENSMNILLTILCKHGLDDAIDICISYGLFPSSTLIDICYLKLKKYNILIKFFTSDLCDFNDVYRICIRAYEEDNQEFLSHISDPDLLYITIDNNNLKLFEIVLNQGIIDMDIHMDIILYQVCIKHAYNILRYIIETGNIPPDESVLNMANRIIINTDDLNVNDALKTLNVLFSLRHPTLLQIDMLVNTTSSHIILQYLARSIVNILKRMKIRTITVEFMREHGISKYINSLRYSKNYFKKQLITELLNAGFTFEQRILDSNILINKIMQTKTDFTDAWFTYFDDNIQTKLPREIQNKISQYVRYDPKPLFNQEEKKE